jgi:F0F1-type ATP synthase assembly protein I
VLLDGWLGTRPLFILLGLLLGLAAAFYGAYRALMQVIATANQKGIDED